MKTSHYIPLLIFLTLLNSSLASGFGYVDYNDDCEFDVVQTGEYYTHVDPYKFCDTERGLQCVPGLGRCGCIIPHTIYRAGKCRAKVDYPCVTLDSNIRINCIQHAICNNNNTSRTFKCQCERGYLPNVERTSCFYVGRNSDYILVGNNYVRATRYGPSSSYYYGFGTASSVSVSKLVIAFGAILTTVMCNCDS